MNTCDSRKLSRRAGIAALLLLAAPTVLLAAAPPELAGDWQGKLNVNPTTSLTVRFTFTKGANGAYTAVLNSPDNSAVKNTAVSAVTWDGTNLKFAVPTLQGSYAGKLAGGKIAGQWTQPGGPLPLELAPFQKVTLTADAMKPYVGTWNSKLTLAGNSQTLVFEFKQGAGGLEGKFKIPDQGLDRPMTDVTVENGELSWKVNVGAEISFKGKLTGSTIAGKLKVPSPVAPPDGVDLVVQKGNYQPPPVALKLTAENFAALKGKWQGKGAFTNPQNNQKIDFTMALRFEAGPKGEYFGYVDSSRAGQSSTGVIINEATMTGDKVIARIAVAQAEFIGTVAGNKITGELSQGGQKIPLELTRAP
jgi:hypothetical protein